MIRSSLHAALMMFIRTDSRWSGIRPRTPYPDSCSWKPKPLHTAPTILGRASREKPWLRTNRWKLPAAFDQP